MLVIFLMMFVAKCFADSQHFQSEMSYPTAIPVNTDELSSKLDKLIKTVAELNPSLNMLTNDLFKRDLDNSIRQLKEAATGINTLTTSVKTLNALIKPISQIANEKLIATEIEAKTKQAESLHKRNMELAHHRAASEGITVWNAMQLNDGEEQASIVPPLILSFISGGILAMALGPKL